MDDSDLRFLIFFETGGRQGQKEHAPFYYTHHAQVTRKGYLYTPPNVLLDWRCRTSQILPFSTATGRSDSRLWRRSTGTYQRPQDTTAQVATRSLTCVHHQHLRAHSDYELVKHGNAQSLFQRTPPGCNTSHATTVPRGSVALSCPRGALWGGFCGRAGTRSSNAAIASDTRIILGFKMYLSQVVNL